MKPKHIAFLSAPASGHINPTLPVVAELARRGHRVTYATGPAFTAAIKAAGAEPVVLDWDPKPVKVSKGGQTTEDLAEMLLTFIGSARRVMPAVQRWLVDDRPDLFCYDMMTFLGPMLAGMLDLPQATTVPNFAGNETFKLESVLVPADFDPTHPRFLDFLAARSAFAEDFGVPVEAVAAAGAISPLNLVFIPREFQLAAETFDDRFRFVGPAIGPRAETSEWQPPSDGAPILFISLGTAVNDRPDFFALCAEAFGGTGWQVAMAVGDQVDRLALGEIPANFDVRRYFPQPAVLQRATAFVSHAGMNSVMEAFLFEVPLVAFPQTAEQTANAQRVAELGLGCVLGGDLTSEGLRQAVDEVTDSPVIRANLAAMAAHIAAAGGPEAAADAVEAVLASNDRSGLPAAG